MRRKIILHGPSSLTVSLPSSWVKQNSLKKGDDVDVAEESNSLVIRSAENNAALKSIEISFIGLDENTRHDLILALHRNGYDEIKILVDKHNIVKEIHSHLNLLQLGYEIIKQESNSITLRNILSPDVEQFDNLFRRIFRMTLEYSKKIGAIIESKEGITDSCLMHETSIHRISNYCRRIIVKDKLPNACFLYSILSSINFIAHTLTNLLQEIRAKDNLSKKFISQYWEACSLLSDVYGLFYKFSLKEYGSIKKKIDDFNIPEKLSKEDVCYFNYI